MKNIKVHSIVCIFYSSNSTIQGKNISIIKAIYQYFFLSKTSRVSGFRPSNNKKKKLFQILFLKKHWFKHNQK